MNRRHLGCGNVKRSRGCAVQNKGITLSAKLNEFLVRVRFERYKQITAMTRSLC